VQTGALSTISKGLAELGDTPVWTLGDDDLVAEFAELWRVEQRVAALRLARLAELDSRGVPGRRGWRAHPVGWWAGYAAATMGHQASFAAGNTRTPGLVIWSLHRRVESDPLTQRLTTIAFPNCYRRQQIDRCRSALLVDMLSAATYRQVVESFGVRPATAKHSPALSTVDRLTRA
jgi:hypothetical protein